MNTSTLERIKYLVANAQDISYDRKIKIFSACCAPEKCGGPPIPIDKKLAAFFLDVSTRTINNYINNGVLQPVYISEHKLLFKWTDILRLIDVSIDKGRYKDILVHKETDADIGSPVNSHQGEESSRKPHNNHANPNSGSPPHKLPKEAEFAPTYSPSIQSPQGQQACGNESSAGGITAENSEHGPAPNPITWEVLGTEVDDTEAGRQPASASVQHKQGEGGVMDSKMVKIKRPTVAPGTPTVNDHLRRLGLLYK